MTQTHDAFKMPYEEKENEEYISFDKHGHNEEVHSEMEVYEHLIRDDESDEEAVVPGID